MKFISGHCPESFLMMQGGAGPMDPSKSGIAEATACLKRIAETSLASGIRDPLELATQVLMGLEDDPQFNAGYGSALQADGKPRLSASLMDGKNQRFSGVISIMDMRYPSRLARSLQDRSSRVLTAPGCYKLAQELGLKSEDLVTSKRLDAWYNRRRDSAFDCDTVGVVLCPRDRSLVAGTSTGGRGFEFPGRVSDSATVAGNYASPHAAISATGIGEQIVDDALCARIETRVRDGLSLEEACRRTFEESKQSGHRYGWIACDSKGNWCVAHSSDQMSFWVQTYEGGILASS